MNIKTPNFRNLPILRHVIENYLVKELAEQLTELIVIKF